MSDDPSKARPLQDIANEEMEAEMDAALARVVETLEDAGLEDILVSPQATATSRAAIESFLPALRQRLPDGCVVEEIEADSDGVLISLRNPAGQHMLLDTIDGGPTGMFVMVADMSARLDYLVEVALFVLETGPIKHFMYAPLPAPKRKRRGKGA